MGLSRNGCRGYEGWPKHIVRLIAEDGSDRRLIASNVTQKKNARKVHILREAGPPGVERVGSGALAGLEGIAAGRGRF